MRIIPAIDIIEGKCVRLTKGDYGSKKIYSADPLEVAKRFEAHGIRHLHLVDLDGARSRQVVNHKVLEAIATHTKLKIDFGGGIKSDKDLKMVFDCGASQVTGGSIAVNNRELFSRWVSIYGADRIILGADAKDEKIATGGWQEDSGEDLIAFIKSYQKKGIQYVICTDIAKDGMLEGPSTELYQRILRNTARLETTVGLSGVEDKWVYDINLIASGGITTVEDLHTLREIGCEAAIIGKALYEDRISLKELEHLIQLE